MNKSLIIRFAVPSAIVSILVFPLALLFILYRPIPIEDHLLLVTLWCLLPFIWGLWSVCIPYNWVMDKYPLWGAILGLILGVVVIFFLNLHYRVFQLSLNIPFQIVAVLLIIIMYYLLWMLVRNLLNKLKEK